MSIFFSYPDIKFCRVRYKTKTPFEKDWPNKPYSFEEIRQHVRNGENYGVLCGPSDLIVIDCDEPEVYERVKSLLPKTFIVKTGREGGGHHAYFFCPEVKQKIILDANHKHWGEVQSYGTMVVGPGSVHPSGQKYSVVSDSSQSGNTSLEIAKITYPQLISAIKPFYKELVDAESQALTERNNYENLNDESFDIDSLSITDIWSTAGLKPNNNGEYFGEHPVHGSTTGMNFWMNPSKNTWHCFRCGTGGGAFSALAVDENILDCSECTRGALRDDKVKETIEAAKRRGLGSTKPFVRLANEIMNVGAPTQQTQVKKEAPPIKKAVINVRTFTDFRNLAIDNTYFVKDFILPKTVTMLYSKPGEYKSMLALYLAMCVANGEKWLDLDTQKHPVLYMDGENRDQDLKKRLEAIHKGMGFKEEEFPLYIVKSGTLMTSRKIVDIPWLEGIKDIIREKKIKIMFLDTIHRYCGYDENSADDINKLYTEIFQPLIDEFGLSIVFLHHSSKAGGYRGSGDFLGMVDTSYSLRSSKGAKLSNGLRVSKFELTNEKNRSGEQDKIHGEIEFDQDKNITIFKTTTGVGFKNAREQGEDMQKQQCEEILDLMDEGVEYTMAEIMARAKELGKSWAKRTTIQRRVYKLIEEGSVIPTHDKHNSVKTVRLRDYATD